MSEDECSKQLKAEIQQLKAKLSQQEALLSDREKWEGEQLYAELRELEELRAQKQAQYKTLMRDHFKFAKSSALERQGDAYLEEKLKVMVMNVGHQIDHILYSRSSKSSISSSSSLSNVQYSDWLEQEKEQEHIRQQEKILEEIRELEKILQNMK